MPIPDLGSPLLDDTDADAPPVNAKFDALAAVLDPVNGTGLDGDNFPPDAPGGIWLCDGAGRPRFVTLSGGASVDDNGVVTLALPTGAVAPGCELARTTAQTIPHVVNTPLAFPAGTEIFDTGAMHDTSTNNSRITIPTTGVYVVCASADFNTNGSGSREVFIAVNGSVINNAGELSGASSSFRTMKTVSTIHKFTAGDYVQAMAFQNSGGDLDVKGDQGGTRFAAQLIGSGV